MQTHHPWIEADRLAALRSYDILDSPTEDLFVDFVNIAAAACDAPIAVVNLIDNGRQWFAAEIGLGIRESPLDISICAHAILQPDVFVVPDLSQDHRFDCNPLVTGAPGLRFYGGALLETPAGLPLGTMCVLDYKPRPDGLTERQTYTLRALARQVMTQLELRRANAEKDLLVQEAHHRVKNSLQMIQALLTLQAKATTHPEAAHQLQESAGRIGTFGAMHDHLYRAGATLHVDLADYLDRLVQDLNNGLASTLGRKIAFNSPSILWPTSAAPSVGLVLLELATNALKYGQGTVSITAAIAVTDGLSLTVEDEGKTLPVDFDPTRTKGLGMRLLATLLRGAHGSLAVDRSKGHTCFVGTMQRS